MEVLETRRLSLRPLTLDDAPVVAREANDMRVAHTTRLPHPYGLQDAREWIGNHENWHQEGSQFIWGLFESGAADPFRGVIGLVVNPPQRHAELGYWLGVPHWGRGLATEAAKAVVAWAFDDLNIIRLHGQHVGTNQASGKVLTKCGFKPEGILRQHLIRFGVVHDVHLYGLLEEEWDSSNPQNSFGTHGF